MADPRFDCAPSLRLAAHEKMSDLHYAQLRDQMQRIEEMMERLERRLWLTVYGVVGVILAQGVQHLISQP